jgi:hypothetical protein
MTVTEIISLVATGIPPAGRFVIEPTSVIAQEYSHELSPQTSGGNLYNAKLSV